MPSKNTLKIYIKDGYYHIYNRGVAKQKIFLDSQDFKVFLKYLKESLGKPVVKKIFFTLQGQSFKGMPRPVKNFHKNIDFIAFCLMPNHFHFLIKQVDEKNIESFMRSLITRYSRYFNKKYERVGHVFQGRYKAALITEDNYLLHLTRYIHLNPSEYVKDITRAYSSYGDYIGLRKTPWIKPDFIIKFFSHKTLPELTIKKINDYKRFVENYQKDSKQVLGELTLE